MDAYDDFVILVKMRQAESAAQYIKEYCLEHKNCQECCFYNGTCRLNNIPTNWDLKGVENG